MPTYFSTLSELKRMTVSTGLETAFASESTAWIRMRSTKGQLLLWSLYLYSTQSIALPVYCGSGFTAFVRESKSEK